MGLFTKFFKNKKEERKVVKPIKENVPKKKIVSKQQFTSIEKKEVQNQPEVIYEKIPFSVIECDEIKFASSFFNDVDENKYKFIVGTNTESNLITQDISRLPNLLIGGTITTGKTSYIKTIICNLLIYKSPSNLKIIILDSKRIEYNEFNSIPHLLTPVITNPEIGRLVLEKVYKEIEERYNLLLKSNSRSFEEYNQNTNQKLYNILIIIDEYMTFNFDHKLDYILEKITLDGWKVGVNVILAVNHPSSEVISDLTKANFLTRISFRTTSMSASRIILGTNGAEKICEKGELLFLANDTIAPIKVKGMFLPQHKMTALINLIISKYSPIHSKYLYDEKFMNLHATADEHDNEGGHHRDVEEEYDDPLYNEIVDFVIETQKASASLLQRRFKVGYNRAARIIDLLEERGIIGPQNGAAPREVLLEYEKNN